MTNKTRVFIAESDHLEVAASQDDYTARGFELVGHERFAFGTAWTMMRELIPTIITANPEMPADRVVEHAAAIVDRMFEVGSSNGWVVDIPKGEDVSNSLRVAEAVTYGKLDTSTYVVSDGTYPLGSSGVKVKST
jgi:hypothetical protein